MKLSWKFIIPMKHIRLDTPSPKIIESKKNKKEKHKKDLKKEIIE